MNKLLFGSFAALATTLPYLATGCLNCTEIGCDSGVALSVVDAALLVQDALPATVHACAGAVCNDFVIDADAKGKLGCTVSGEPAPCSLGPEPDTSLKITISEQGESDTLFVKIVIKSKDGVEVFSDQGVATLSSRYPNGKLCGAACHGGFIAFVPTSS